MRALYASIASVLLAALAPGAFAQQPGLSLSSEFGYDRARGLQLDPAPWRSKLFFGGFADQGLNPARAGIVDDQLRVVPPLLRDLPAPPRLGPPVDPGALSQAGAYLGYRFDQFQIASSVRQGFGLAGDSGTRVDLGASYGFDVTPRHLITLSGGVTLGQGSSGTPYAAAFSYDGTRGYRVGEPGAGLRLSWRYALDRNLYLDTSLGYDRAYGDAADALQGADRGTASFGTVFGYRW